VDVRLDVLTLDECQLVRLWRNECLETLRTPYPLTEQMQEEFYRDVICNRNSRDRYWSILTTAQEGDGHDFGTTEHFVGMGGLANIFWENGIAEISLIINPACHRKGYGTKAVDLLLEQAFDQMGLRTVFGECYLTHTGWDFWEKIVEKYHGYDTILINRKMWKGELCDSMYFSIDANEWRRNRVTA